MPEYFSIKQAAEYLNCSEQTIRRMIDDKDILAYKLRWLWRIDREDLEEWLIKQKKANQ